MFPDSFFAHRGDSLLTIFFIFVFIALIARWPHARIFGWKTVFAIFFLGNAADYLSTLLFVQQYGVIYERTDFLRTLMEAGWSWFAAYKLVIIPAAIYLYTLILCRKHPIFAAVPLAFGATLFIMVANNVATLIRLLSG